MLPASPFSNNEEQRAFHFFRAHTYSGLAPLFQSDFWEGIILQACHHEPAIRHSVIALGALHQRFLCGDRGKDVYWPTYSETIVDTFALQQYTKALRFSIHSTESRTGDSTLMACILFVYFEVLYVSIISLLVCS
jgi:hypothetical protein